MKLLRCYLGSWGGSGYWRQAVASSLAMLLVACATQPNRQHAALESQPREINNICSIFAEKRHWVEPARASYEKWGIPVEVMMAIMYYESSFRAAARPLDRNGNRLSSALGYAQALDGTWNTYQRDTGSTRARRTDYAAAIDFIGWYGGKALHEGSIIVPFDAMSLYVLYHDGHNALPEDGSRELKPQVLQTAAKVGQKTRLYHNQLKECDAIALALYGGAAAERDVRSATNNKRQPGNSQARPSWF